MNVVVNLCYGAVINFYGVKSIREIALGWPYMHPPEKHIREYFKLAGNICVNVISDGVTSNKFEVFIGVHLEELANSENSDKQAFAYNLANGINKIDRRLIDQTNRLIESLNIQLCLQSKHQLHSATHIITLIK